MSGIKTNTQDLNKSFEKLKAQNGADLRKAALIEEYRQEYLRQKYPPLMAHNMAIQKYNQIHK